MSSFSTQSLSEKLSGCFDVIYRAWQDNAKADTHLWELTQGKSASDILQQDVIDVGHFFAAADALSEQAEMYLIAEYIAHLRTAGRPIDAGHSFEQMVERIGAQLLAAQPEQDEAARAQTHAPLSYRIAQFSAIQGFISPETLAVLRETLIEIAYHFTMRDGNVTPEEDARIKEFHAALSS